MVRSRPLEYCNVLRGRRHSAPRNPLMRYVSTRGGMAPARFSDVVLEGLAPDGGLVVPERYPAVTLHELSRWRSLTYPQLAFEVLRRYCDDIAESDFKVLLDQTYTAR